MRVRDYFKEQSWLKRLNRADHGAFLELYDAYAPKVYRHTRLRVPNREIAEDLTSQVFTNTWEYISKKQRPLRSVKAFLFRAANNLITDYYRIKAREIQVEDDIFEEVGVDPEIATKADLVRTQRKVHAALKQIPPQYQDLLQWRYIDDLSIDEIAKLSGKSKDTVYVSLHRALKTLGRIINKLNNV